MGLDKDKGLLSSAACLHNQAKEQLPVNTAELQPPRSKEEKHRLVHELEVHQIELEMQNAELRQARDELELALERYTDLYDFAPTGYFSLDCNGTILRVNFTGAELLGIERTLLIGRRFDQFIVPENRPAFSAFLRNVFETQIKDSCEVNFVNKRHEPLFARVEAAACMPGRECHVAAIDITERKRAEAEVWAAKCEAERYGAEMATLMDAVPAAVLIAHDIECRHMSGSRIAQDLLGLPATANFSKSALPKERPANFILMKDGREVPADQLPVEIAASGREVRDFELDVVFADGTVRTIFGNAMPLLDTCGHPRGAIGAFIDITERKQMEEALLRAKEDWERTFNALPDLISILDTEHRIVRVNRAMADQLGLMPEECIGQRCYATIHGTTEPPAFCPHSQLLFDGREHSADICEASLGGDYRLTVSPLLDPGGKVVGSVHVAHDISESKRAEKMLKEANELLVERVEDRSAKLNDAYSLLEENIIDQKLLEKKLSEAKKLEAIGQLAAGVAHEVRNPLNAILSITEALFRENEIEGNPEYEPYIQHIRAQVGRLTQLMKDLLELGKPILASSLYTVPLLQLCADTVALLTSSGSLRHNRVMIVSDREPTDPLVLADGVKLQQVLFNVIENAAQHSPEGSEIVIRLVYAGSSGSPERMAVVRITDAGKGIPADRIARVFDPFYTSRRGGTGLGLALVKHFTEHMGGSAELWNNDPPPGCTMEIRIPLAKGGKG